MDAVLIMVGAFVVGSANMIAVLGILCLFMVVMTSWALILNQGNFLKAGKGLLIAANAIILAIVVWMIIGGIGSFCSRRKEGGYYDL